MLRRLVRYVLRVLRETANNWQQDDGFLLSAAMAYYAAFSLFPLCLVLVSIAGFALRISRRAEDAQHWLIVQISERTGPWLGQQLETLLAGVKTHATLGGPFGAATLLLAAIVVFVQLDYMFDRIFGTPPSARPSVWGYLRVVLHDRFSAFVTLTVVFLLLLALFVANMVFSGLQADIENRWPDTVSAWNWSRFAGTIIINALLLSLIYKFLPKVRIRWRDALAGGLLVSLVWIAGERLLVRFLIGPSYTAYGVVGSFIAVMIWVYYISAIVFLGAEFIEALAIVGGRAVKTRRPAPS